MSPVINNVAPAHPPGMMHVRGRVSASFGHSSSPGFSAWHNWHQVSHRPTSQIDGVKLPTVRLGYDSLVHCRCTENRNHLRRLWRIFSSTLDEYGLKSNAWECVNYACPTTTYKHFQRDTDNASLPTMMNICTVIFASRYKCQDLLHILSLWAQLTSFCYGSAKLQDEFCESNNHVIIILPCSLENVCIK